MKNGRYRQPAWFASAIALVFSALSMNAATLTVNSSADAGGSCPGANCTLRQAIATAASGDTIIFDARLSAITLTTNELLINKNLTIKGPGANLLSVQRSTAAGTPLFRIFEIAASVNATIADLTITNGVASGLGNGGGIYNGGTVGITGCAISGNTGAGADNEGGGLYNASSSTITVTNCTLASNSNQFGGGIFNLGTLTLTGSTLSGNTTGNHGAGIYTAGGTATITNSTITSNQASIGGGIYNGGGTINLKNTIVALNTAFNGDRDIHGAVSSQGYNFIGDTTGAAITGTTTGNQLNANPNLDSLRDNGGPTKTHALLSGSKAIEGGNSSGATTDQRGFARPVDDPAIANASGGDGSDIGAFEVQPDQLPGCASLGHVVGNTNDAGTDSLRAIMSSVCSGTAITFAPSVRGTLNLTSGELLINKSLTITGPGANLLTIQRSPAAGTNFRIFHINGNFNASISGLTIAEGFLPGNLGGGISNDNGSLILDGVTVSGNTADIGAGIYTARAATISNSTISGNTVTGNIAGDGGGGIYNQGGTLNLINSTLSGNVAQIPSSGGQGGGIRNNLGTVSIISTTIAGNSADQGGGIYHSNGGSVTFQNSIIGQNTSANGADLNGTFSSGGFNLIGNSTGAILNSALFSDQIGNASSPLNPGLDILRNNGGPTFTRALLPGSPAIDKGNASGSSKDQRGLPRPIDFSFIVNANTGDGSDIGAFEVQPGTTLANISTRLRVETGDNALIGGFIVTGTQPKKVILLAIGPSLPLADTLANPTLELYSGNTLLQSNDDWVNSPDKQAIIDSSVAPTNNLESAIIATLPANNSQYTAIVRGLNNTTGIGVVQAYDLDRLVDSKLANISTRGFVQTGDNVLIAGTILLGQASQKVIVRAIGPSLPFSGTLADPTLELRDQNGSLIDSNDNWKDSPNKQAIIDSTIPPTNDSESAIVAILPANSAQYTAIVRGVNNGTGIGVVEVYTLN